MLNSSPKPCTHDDCDWWAYRKKLCVTHFWEAYPPQYKPRVTPVSTPGKPRKASKSRSRPPKEDIPLEVREVVLARSDGLCEACGFPVRYGVHMHHRKRRGDSEHVPNNLVALHPSCHVVAPEAVHQRVAWARERGLIVPTWFEPEDVPLTMADGRLVMLDPVEPVYLPVPDDLKLAV